VVPDCGLGIVVPDCRLGIVELDCALGVVVDGVVVEFVVCADAAVINAAPSAKATTAVTVYFMGITPKVGVGVDSTPERQMGCWRSHTFSFWTRSRPNHNCYVKVFLGIRQIKERRTGSRRSLHFK
jgi:hypothetical protein